jgi:hypothetical protein
LHLHLEDPGAAGAHPTRATADQGWRLGHVDNGVDHAEVRQHPQDPTDAGVDRVLVEPPCLSPFVEEDASATFAGGIPKRSVTELGVEDDPGAEGLGELTGLWVVEVAAHLREVGAAIGAGVQIDADLALVDDLGHEEVRDAAGE